MENRFFLYSKENGSKTEIVIPGDKSISHRALILASMSLGITKIIGLSNCRDVDATISSLKNLGVTIERDFDCIKVYGNGILSLNEPLNALNTYNSGTTTRLLMGLVAPFCFPVTFTGDISLSNRPMDRIINPLKQIGVKIISRNNKLPITICGPKYPFPLNYELSLASSQVKSAILLSGINIKGTTIIHEKLKSRDHTEIMMKYLGYELITQDNIISLKGLQEVKAKDIEVAGDPSSALFIIAAALLREGSEITIRNICVNETRIAAYKVLQEMGANIEFENFRKISDESVTDVRVKYSKLKAIDIAAKLAAFMIDEYPIISVLASFAEGTTRMYGLSELKYKESNRLNLMKENLTKAGIKVKLDEDNIFIEGKSEIEGDFVANTGNDHRIAMAFLIMGIATKNPIYTRQIDMIANSFPEFFELLEKCGIMVGQDFKN